MSSLESSNKRKHSSLEVEQNKRQRVSPIAAGQPAPIPEDQDEIQHLEVQAAELQQRLAAARGRAAGRKSLGQAPPTYQHSQTPTPVYASSSYLPTSSTQSYPTALAPAPAFGQPGPVTPSGANTVDQPNLVSFPYHSQQTQPQSFTSQNTWPGPSPISFSTRNPSRFLATTPPVGNPLKNWFDDFIDPQAYQHSSPAITPVVPESSESQAPNGDGFHPTLAATQPQSGEAWDASLNFDASNWGNDVSSPVATEALQTENLIRPPSSAGSVPPQAPAQLLQFASTIFHESTTRTSGAGAGRRAECGSAPQQRRESSPNCCRSTGARRRSLEWLSQLRRFKPGHQSASASLAGAFSPTAGRREPTQQRRLRSHESASASSRHTAPSKQRGMGWLS
ncbi:MAG: hypothetical protein L6R39_005884 [Caloplaca ligustica]|nr:MAG: hypothetical protein L6R39_005884 [Caloplaca ligustica]